MKLPRIKIGRPQRLAALLLLFFLAECLWVVNRQQLSQQDYRYAECGREMWERPSPLAGYFTTCGNLNGDGTFAYRVAGLPLTVQRLTMLGADKLRKPENRLYAEGTLHGSTWEARHELFSVKYLLHLPFIFFAIWLGGGLWWVSRRLFGNEGGFFALGLYCFCPAIVRSAVTPNNDVLAMWGLYGLVYAAMGVAHAMQGPRRKWRPRIILLTLALGLTAAAHLLAAILGFLMAMVWMIYLAERRRSHVMQILVSSAIGAMVILFASFAFRPGALQLRIHRWRRAVLVFAGRGSALLPECGQRPDRGGDAGGASALHSGAALSLLRQYGPSGDGAASLSAGHDADGLAAVAMGASLPVHVCRRRICGRSWRRSSVVCSSSSQRRNPSNAGDALPDAVAGDRAIACGQYAEPRSAPCGEARFAGNPHRIRA